MQVAIIDDGQGFDPVAVAGQTHGFGLQAMHERVEALGSTGVPAAKSLGVSPVDLDSDGWIDLVVANDTVPNYVFLNQRNGTFREIGAASGIAFDSYGSTRGAMGIDTARHRNDTALGIAIGNFANEMTALYVSQHSPTNFADEAITEGVGPASRLLLKFGIFFFDYDLDGRLDLLGANGHLEEEIGKIQASQRYAQPAQLFWNSGAPTGATFQPVDARRGRRPNTTITQTSKNIPKTHDSPIAASSTPTATSNPATNSAEKKKTPRVRGCLYGKGVWGKPMPLSPVGGS